MGLGQPNQSYPYYPVVPVVPPMGPTVPPAPPAPLPGAYAPAPQPIVYAPAVPADSYVPAEPPPGYPTVPPVAYTPAVQPVAGMPTAPTAPPVTVAPVGSLPDLEPPRPTAPPAPPAPPADQWVPSQPTVPPAPTYRPQKVAATSNHARFARMDANHSGKVSEHEFKAGGGDSFRRADRNHDHRVTWREYQATRLTDQSFQHLDRNRDGVLRDREIARIETPSGAAFDADGDGKVTKKEFLAARAKDRKAVGRPDGRKVHQRALRIFKQADLDRNGRLTGDELGRHKAYDRNHNRMISQAEFMRGLGGDRARAQEQLAMKGRLPDHLARRLWRDRLGEGRKVPKPGMWLDPHKVAAILGSPVENVKRSLPGILKALDEAGIKDRAAIIAVLATIRTEVGSFMPIHEYGGPSYWSRYNWRSDLGNVHAGDGVRYHGRGFIQLTGRANYRTYGRAIGIDLEKHPNKALDPKVAAEVLIAYFKSHGIPDMARGGNWGGVRTAVNGGYNGWDTFIWAVRRLQGAGGWLKR